MIVAEGKPLEEIKSVLAGYQKILVVGCGTCVTVCRSGGEREVEKLASQLCPLEVLTTTITRQCEKEFVDTLSGLVKQVEAVLSMGCGAGVQMITERFANIPVYAGTNTKFLGIPEEQGLWEERCVACGDCILNEMGGICPIVRCAKSLLNGPCGGSQNGKCEIDPGVACGWQLIYDRLKTLGQLDKLTRIIPPKDWSFSKSGGLRKMVKKSILA